MRRLDHLPDRGILHAKAGRRNFTLTRFAPTEDLAPYVEHYWFVRWDLRGQEPYRQVILSHPSINLVFERESIGIHTGVHGIREISDSKLLIDEGTALGVKFRAGGFYPFWRQPISQLKGITVPGEQLFGAELPRIEQRLFAQSSGEQMAAEAEMSLRGLKPVRDPDAELASEIVEAAARNREIALAGELAAMFGMSLRSLQRLFNQYVGVSPKWVIRRFRLHDAAQLAEQGETPDWSQLSAELGYFDQSHFIKDFKAVTGRSPEAHVRAHQKLTQMLECDAQPST